MSFVKHELKMNLKSLLIWSLAVAIMLLSFLVLFESVKDQVSQMSDAYANMGSMSQAFGMDKISIASPMGYYAIECSMVLSLGGAMFAAILGITMLAKEEGGHATEFIYVTPNSRNYFLTTKFISITILLVIFNVIATIAAIGGFLIIDADVEWSHFLLFHGAQFMMHWEIAAICFGISAFLRKSNIGLGIGIALVLYFVNTFANVTDKVEDLHYISPFYYADGPDLFSTGELRLGYVAIGLSIAVVSLILAYVKYNRKDLAV